LHDLLVDGPFVIETATDGYEALVKVGTFRPALIILDVVLAGLDGVEACRCLRRMPETKGVRILGVTGHPSMVPVLLGAGADACVTKPLDLELVYREVNRLTSAAVCHPLTGREGCDATDSIPELSGEGVPADQEATHRHLVRQAPHIKLTVVGTVAEAIERLAIGDMDVMLADYRLPDGTGLDLLEAVKSRGLEVPVVLVT